MSEADGGGRRTGEFVRLKDGFGRRTDKFLFKAYGGEFVCLEDGFDLN